MSNNEVTEFAEPVFTPTPIPSANKYALKPIEEYYKMVTITTEKYYISALRGSGFKLPSDLKNDIYQVASLALVEAYNNFDITRNASFNTYGFYRITGAVGDYLRKLDSVNRGIRNVMRKVSNELGGDFSTVDTEALANSIGISEDEIKDAFKKNIVFQSINDIYQEDPQFVAPDSLADFKSVESQIFLEKLLDKTTLTKAQRSVITKHYYEFKTFKEISVDLAATESRISQLHSVAIKKLTTELSMMNKSKEDRAAHKKFLREEKAKDRKAKQQREETAKKELTCPIINLNIS